MESIISRNYIVEYSEQISEEPYMEMGHTVTSFKEMEDLAEKGVHFFARETNEGYENYGFSFKLGTSVDFGSTDTEILGDIFPSCKVAFGTMLGKYEEPDKPIVVLVQEDKIIFMEEFKYFEGLIIGHLLAEHDK